MKKNVLREKIRQSEEEKKITIKKKTKKFSGCTYNDGSCLTALAPSNFDATWSTANEWIENSAGRLDNWGVNNSLGARPDSY